MSEERLVSILTGPILHEWSTHVNRALGRGLTDVQTPYQTAFAQILALSAVCS